MEIDLGAATPFLGDVNGDGKADLILLERSKGLVYALPSA
jgi:hypothetical protein